VDTKSTQSLRSINFQQSLNSGAYGVKSAQYKTGIATKVPVSQVPGTPLTPPIPEHREVASNTTQYSQPVQISTQTMPSVVAQVPNQGDSLTDKKDKQAA
jgi:hypothetical protein